MTKPNQTRQQDEPQRPLSIVLWILSAAYIYVLLLSPPGQVLPGEPVWAIQPETLQEIWNESINFFFILPILNAVGINFIQAAIAHPWLEALFNFAEAWMFMFLPLLLADPRGRRLPKLLIWSLAMFLTNTFLIPYMALRLVTPQVQAEDEITKGLIARVFGWTGLIVGSIALIWSVFGRPEFGDFTEKAQYLVQDLMSNRVTIAFCVDLVLFALFQAILLGTIEPRGSGKRWLRFIPFWGLAAWLIF
ncbi:MAG TPA: hypothetical protein V6C85_29325 [Allocoleopsis sp.]